MTRRTTPRAAVLTALAVTAGTLFQSIGAPVPAGAAEPIPTAERFVRQAYVDAIGNADPQPVVVKAGVDAITRGRADNRWLGDLLLTDRGRLAFIETQYVGLLGRKSTPAGAAHWLRMMKAGASREEIRGGFGGSAEYHDRVSNGDHRTFVDNLYRDFLGRSASDAGRAYWFRRLDAGLSRTAMATEFATIEEGRKFRVQSFYRTYLNRQADAAGLARFTAQLGRGVTEEAVIVELTGSAEYRSIAYTLPAAEPVALLSASGNLTIRRPGGIDTTVAITGLTAGTTLVGIDVRPATGVLYGLGSDGQLYGVNRSTGTADKVGTPIPTFDATSGVGFDFNPAADRVRVVAGTKNYRLQPDTGAVLGEGATPGTPGTIQYVPGDVNEGRTPSVSAATYVNSTRGLPLPATTAIYDIDVANDVVAEQNPANSGNLVTKGSLLLNASAVNGFDTSPDGGQVSYAVLKATYGQGLYKIDLATGEPKLIEKLGADPIVGLAVLGTEQVAPAEAAFGVPEDGLSLVTFTTANTTVTATQAFAGLTAGTRIVAIDVRPSTGQLFAIGSDGQLYTVDTSVANVATVAKANPITGQIGGGTFDASQGVAMDFNPAADRIRVVVGTKNYRVQTNGVVDGEGPVNTGLPGTVQYVAGGPGAGTTPAVGGAAYTNSGRSATFPAATALFDLESNRDVLVRQNPANAGDLTTIGALGVDIDGTASFDISGGPGQNAYAVLRSGGVQSLYLVDLTTGKADKVADLPGALSAFAIR
ncbi:hypothetical protein BH10ACT1_BH10ACT1_32040 [soil metagenome]